MKIYEAQGPGLPLDGKGKTKNEETEQGDFQKIMDGIISSPDKGGGVSNAGGLGPVPGGFSIIHTQGQISETLNVAEKDQIIGQLEETLDLVDFYITRLNDSSLSAEGISPLVDHLEDRLETLHNMESVLGRDEQLKPIISDIAIALGSEIAKFRRGDYS